MEYEEFGFDYKSLLKKKYLIYTLLGIGIIACTYAYAEKKYASITVVRMSVGERNKEVRDIDNFRERHENFLAYKKSLEDKNKQALINLPHSYDEQEFLKIIDETAVGIKIVNIILPSKRDVLDVKEEKSVKLYPAKVQLEGDYYDVLKFVKSLEEKHFAISNLKIKADKVGYLEISMTIGKFVLP